ncbi:MAG: DUF5985 family protein [Steroidobacter sp.]
MDLIVNILGALTVFICAVLLLRGYARTRKRLLLWSGLCFLGLTGSNVLLLVDLSVVPDINLYSVRLGVAAGSMLLLLYGLVLESD